MAKAPETTTPAFNVETGIALPPIQRLSGGGKESPYAKVMKSLKLGTSEKTIQSFFIPANVPATLKGEEKTKAANEEVRKISNRVSGIARRLAKQDAQMRFTLRSREENGQLGVRVYRVSADLSPSAGGDKKAA